MLPEFKLNRTLDILTLLHISISYVTELFRYFIFQVQFHVQNVHFLVY